MDEYNEMSAIEDANATINSKLRQVFDGRIARKDLTKKISDDPDVMEMGVNNVKRILAENYVRCVRMNRKKFSPFCGSGAATP